MKKGIAAALLAGTMLLAGCSGKGAKAAVASCSTEQGVFKMTFEFHAPAEDKPIDQMKLIFDMDMKTMLGDALTGEAMDSALKEIGEEYTSEYAEQLGIPEEDFTLASKDGTITLTANIKDIKAFAEKNPEFGELKDEDMIFSKVKEEIGKEFTCE